MKALCFLLIPAYLIFTFSPHLFAHEQKQRTAKNQDTSQNLARIDSLYLRDIRPLFQKKCFDCHSQFTKYPWYYKFPLLKSMIDQDIKEGKEHMDFSNDFPFSGHGSPKEDLEAIEKSVLKNTMPPLRYNLLHRDSSLTQSEKKTILRWISQSLKILEEK